MSYASEVLADSPVAWYRMQESSGLLQDSSGNANHATVSTGTASYAQTGPITSEPTDDAILFSGDDGFTAPHHATLNVGDSFTLECWVKRTSGAGLQYIARKQHVGGFEFFLNGAKFVMNRAGSAPSPNIAESSAALDTNWHHCVATKSGATSKIYVDGVDVTVLGTNLTISDSSSVMAIGYDSGGSSNFLVATLDELALYDTALSAARVLAHYVAATSVTPSPPSAAPSAPVYWVKLAANGVGGGPWDPSSTPVWTDITAYVRGMSWQRGRGSSIDEIGPGSGTLRLRNEDRRFEPGFAAGPYNPIRPFRPINIGCTWNSIDYSLFWGFAEEWKVIWDHTWGTAYSEVEVTLVDAIPLLNNARFAQTFAAQALSSARISTVLSNAIVRFPTAMREITAVGTLCKATATAAPTAPTPGEFELTPSGFGTGGFGNYASAWEVIQAHVVTHPGDLPFWIDRRGFACYKAAVASGLTFGDSGSELKYRAASLNDGVDQVYNAVDVTAEGGVVQQVLDSTSRTRYLYRSFARTTLSISDAAALAVANYILSNYKDPKARLEGFQVRPGGTSALWDAVITLDLESTITVNRRPPGGGTMFSQVPKIVGLQWDVPQIGISQDTTVSYTLTGTTI